MKEDGYYICFVSGVGSVAAIAASQLMWEQLEPYKNYINSIRAASGSTIPLSLAASGMRAAEIRKNLLKLHIKDLVEDIGFFAEHNQDEGIFGKMRDLRAYYLRWFGATKTIVNHLVDHRIGIVRGENIKKLLDEHLCTNDFNKTSPPLEIVATQLEGSKTYIFSGETTPDVSISEAVVASCAIRHIIAIQNIKGRQFVDAAQKESLPILSVIDSHINHGNDPKKLLIIGSFVHTLPRQGPSAYHFLEMEKYYSSSGHSDLFRKDMEIAKYKYATKCLILEFDSTNVSLPSPDPFPEFLEFGAGFRQIRKLFAAIFNRVQLEKLLRGVSIHLYKELNMQHLPCYLELFERNLQGKINRHLKNIDT